MKRTIVLLASLALVATLTPATHLSAQESIVGSWVTDSWDGQGGDTEPGLLIFTETNYSMMFVPPGVTRERTAETMSDADVVDAFNTLIANSGRYTREGDQITTEAYVALNPNYMLSWGENHETYTVHVDGDMLHVTWPGEFGSFSGMAGTFRRVGR